MMRFPAISVLTALIVLLSSAAVKSADKSPVVEDAYIDLAVPDSPALIALDFSPNKVERPASPREFSTSLLHGVDTNGNVQTGISIEAAPLLWYRGEETTLRDYQQRYFRRFLSRTMISLAVTHGDSADGIGTRFAFGLRFTPWDEGDPRMDTDLATCLMDAVLAIDIQDQQKIDDLMIERESALKQKAYIERKVQEAKTRGDRELEDVQKDLLYDIYRRIDSLNNQIEELQTPNFAELNARSAAGFADCRRKKEYRERLWSGSSLSVGIAPTFTSAKGTSDDIKSSGTAVWTSFAYNVWYRSQVIAHVRYHKNELAPNPFVAGRLLRQDTLRAGGRVRVGRPDLNFNVEGIFVKEDREGSLGTDKKIQYGAGLEYRLTEDLWLAFSVGSEAYDNSEDNLSFLVGLRWAYKPPPVKKY